MRTALKYFILLLLIPLGMSSLFGEGSKELLNNDCANEGDIQIWDNGDPQRQFATWNCDPDYRLNIRVNFMDYIHMGFKQSNEDVWYRLKDPNGNVVLGPTLIASGEPGHVDNCSKLMNGPKSMFPGGYDDVTYQATMAGDYYIEFAVDQDPTYYTKRIFEHFDITVSEEMTFERKGRLWSKAWDLNLRGASNRFHGNFYAYSKDSVVTKFEFNGIRPWGFTISCNSFGASNVGSLSDRRKSDYRQNIINNGGTPGVPEYPLFLNEPDEYEFPNGVFGVIDSFNLNTCDNNSCLDVWVNKEGQVETVLNFENGSQLNIIDSVSPGYNCVEWNGNDGYGNPVQGLDTVWISLKYATGITHLPLMDVENHDFGYSVELIRPATKPNGDPVPDPLIFWNDSLLTDPQNSLDGVANLNGAADSSHRWQNRGTDNSNPEVINTWWYSALEEESYTVICPQILDIKLRDFTGDVRPAGILLNWTSELENDAWEYRVERSLDGKYFVDIGNRKAQNRPTSYQFLDDHDIHSEVLYYRLKMIDRNGEFNYSEAIAIKQNGVLDYQFGWNAGQHQMSLNSNQDFQFEYVVADLSGKTVQQDRALSNDLVQLNDLKPGIYLIQMQLLQSNQIIKKKLVLH